MKYVFSDTERIRVRDVPQASSLVMFSDFSCACCAADPSAPTPVRFFEGAFSIPMLALDPTAVFHSALVLILSTDQPELTTGLLF